MRKLYVTKAGYWYVVLTIGMGVVALATGNNVFYLMECLLLGGMILSGVISERAIRSVEVEWQRKQARVGVLVRDQLVLRNPTRFSFFCLEIGEWRRGRFESLAFVTKIDPRAKLTVPVERSYAQRGLQSWDGMAIATAAPFGFARKVRIIDRPGTRTVWPEGKGRDGRELRESQLAGSGSWEAEVRPYVSSDDARSIVWKLSARGGDPVVRKERLEMPQISLTLDLRTRRGPSFEDAVSRVASSIYRLEKSYGADIRLKILSAAANRTLRGRVAALNYLATAESEGQS